MNLFNCLAVLEFSKYSSCFAAMNLIGKASNFQVFEVSPTPSGGILILAAPETKELEFFYHNLKEQFKTTLVDSCFLTQLKAEVLNCYLSQNSDIQIMNLNFFETNALSEAFVYSQKVVDGGNQLIDFRVIRSIQNRAIVVYSGDQLDARSIKIDHPSEQVRSYFQTLK